VFEPSTVNVQWDKATNITCATRPAMLLQCVRKTIASVSFHFLFNSRSRMQNVAFLWESCKWEKYDF